MRVDALVTFAADHPVFAGHFPGRPMVPGALLLDEVLHAALQAALQTIGAAANGQTDTTANGLLSYCQVASVKFLSPVLPGETLAICCVGSANRPTRFDITCQGRQIATGTFALETHQ